MYVYKCNLCKRIFKSSIPLKSLKCSLCGGNLTFLENKLEAKKEGGSKESCKLLVDLAKFGFTMWGTAGAANTLGKVIEKRKIDRKDIFHTLFPWATVQVLFMPFNIHRRQKTSFSLPKKNLR